MIDSYRIDSPYLSSKDDKKFLYDDVDFSDYGIQLSRSFRALKIWMSLKLYGIEKYGRIIEQNIHLAQYFRALLKESSDFTVNFIGNLSTVCFQYFPKDLYENYQALLDMADVDPILIDAVQKAILNLQPNPCQDSSNVNHELTHGCVVFTDDWAPIEWITNSLVLNYVLFSGMEEIQ